MSKQIALETEYIVMDIAQYLGEVFVRKDPRLTWMFFTTADMGEDRNRPVVAGFSENRLLYPDEPVREIAFYLVDDTARPIDLRIVYELWKRCLPK